MTNQRQAKSFSHLFSQMNFFRTQIELRFCLFYSSFVPFVVLFTNTVYAQSRRRIKNKHKMKTNKQYDFSLWILLSFIIYLFISSSLKAHSHMHALSLFISLIIICFKFQWSTPSISVRVNMWTRVNECECVWKWNGKKRVRRWKKSTINTQKRTSKSYTTQWEEALIRTGQSVTHHSMVYMQTNDNK